MWLFFFFQAEDGIRDDLVTGVQTCALPISGHRTKRVTARSQVRIPGGRVPVRSEEHTSELQSPDHLVCRLLLEKKNLIRTLPTGSVDPNLVRRVRIRRKINILLYTSTGRSV